MNQGQLNQGQGFGLGPLANVREWSTFEWLNYQFAPRLSAGVGAGFTYDNLSVGPDMTSEEYQGRIKWQATDKISLVLSGGLNDMQFLNSSVPDLLSPVFSASVLYQLFLPTTLSVSASRATTPSYFENAVTEVTSVSAGLHQRLLGRLYLDVTGGYGSTSYTGSAVGFNGANLSSYDSGLHQCKPKHHVPQAGQRRGLFPGKHPLLRRNRCRELFLQLYDHPGRPLLGLPILAPEPVARRKSVAGCWF